jgi:hypothetical protein
MVDKHVTVEFFKSSIEAVFREVVKHILIFNTQKSTPSSLEQETNILNKRKCIRLLDYSENKQNN